MKPTVWLREQGVHLGALTGTDHAALQAIAGAWELYAMTRSESLLGAIAALVHEMQPKCRELTRPLIARSMDWSDVEPLWAEVLRRMPIDGRA